METATVTIGRNVGEQPLPDDDWQAFKDATRRVLDGSDIWTDADYIGAWEGVTEDAHVYVAGLPDGNHDDIRKALVSLAAQYHQDAIGLTIGTAQLVGATP